MAANEGSGSGIGGKIQRRRFGRAAATPYDRPPVAVRLNHAPSEGPRGNGWLSKLVVEPAARIISWSASRFLPSGIPRLLPPPAAATERTQESMEEDLEEQFNNLVHGKQEQYISEEKSFINNVSTSQHGADSHVDGVSDLEQLVKKRTFTRDQAHHLNQLLNSRVAESSAQAIGIVNKEMKNVPDETNNRQLQPTPNYDNKDKAVVASEQAARGIFRLHGDHATPASSNFLKEEVGSPTEIAKAYMSSRSSKVSPTAVSMQNQYFRDDKNLPIGTPYGNKSFERPVALRSAIKISEPIENMQHNYSSPKLYGRSALYKMSRAPYVKPHSIVNLRGGKSLVDGSGDPSTTSNIAYSGGRKTLKRDSSVLDDEVGSFGPIRSIRHKSNLTSPSRIPYSSTRHFLPSPSTYVDQGSLSLNQKLHLSEQNKIFMESQSARKSGALIAPIPPQSSQMARKILEELDKLVPTPKEKSSKLKINADSSPLLLTHNMLRGQALKSMEEIDTSKFLNVQRNGTLESSIDNHQQRNSVPQVQNRTEENGSEKLATTDAKVASTASLPEEHDINVPEAKPSVSTTDALLSGAATVLKVKKPSFRISAPEELDELDADGDDKKISSSPTTVVDNKSLMSQPKTTSYEKTKLEKSADFSSVSVNIPTSIIEADPSKVPSGSGTEKVNGFQFSAVPASSSSNLPSMAPVFATSIEKPTPQKEEGSAPTVKVGIEAFAFGSPSVISGSSGSVICANNETTTNILEGSNSNKVGKTLKGGDLFSRFGDAVPSSLSTSGSTGLGVTGVSTTSKLDGEMSLSSITSSVPAVSSGKLDASFASGVSASTSVMVSSTISISAAAPAFSTISSFQFPTSGSLGDHSTVVSTTPKFGSANLDAAPDKSFTLNASSSSSMNTSVELSGTRSNPSVLPTSSLFASMSSGSSAAPPPSPLFTAGSDITTTSMPSFTTSTGGLFNFGAPSQSSGTTASSQKLTDLGASTGSTVSTQPGELGSGVSSPLLNSSGSFGASTPMTMFGLSGNSSSASAPSLFAFSTLASKPLGSSSSAGLSFPIIAGSSANSGSVTAATSTLNFGSSSGFSFSGATVSSQSASSGNSLISASHFGSSSSSFPASATLSTNFGTGNALFGSVPQVSQPSVSASTFGSIASPTTAFPFASATSSGSSPFSFGASSVPGFSFGSTGSTSSSIPASTAKVVFGGPNAMSSLNSSPGNDQMNVEDSMADDLVQSSVPQVATFGQSTNISASPNFMFGSPSTPIVAPSTFQFGGQPNNFIAQGSSPFQPASSLEFPAGGSFSLGMGGGDKARKIVKPRQKLRKK